MCLSVSRAFVCCVKLLLRTMRLASAAAASSSRSLRIQHMVSTSGGIYALIIIRLDARLQAINSFRLVARLLLLLDFTLALVQSDEIDTLCRLTILSKGNKFLYSTTGCVGSRQSQWKRQCKSTHLSSSSPEPCAEPEGPASADCSGSVGFSRTDVGLVRFLNMSCCS